MQIPSNLRFFTFFFVFTALFSVGCGGRDMTPKGPEMGALESYLEEHPELMVDEDEAIDSEDEFENADAE